MDIKKRIANLKDGENEKAKAMIEVSLKTFNNLVDKLDSIEFGADKSVSLDEVYKYIKAQGIDADSLGGFKLEDLALKLHGHDEFKKTFNREEFLEYKKEIQIDSEKISKNLTNLFYDLEKLKNQKGEEKIQKEIIKIKDKSNKIVKSIEKIQKKGLEIVENIDFKGFRVMNIGDPVNATDAVNRKYVDKVSSLLNTKMPTYLGGPVPNPGGATNWGSITGTLANQLDLQSALNAKLGVSAQATDSALLQGHNAAYFQPAGSYLTAETDPIFVASQAHNISATDIIHLSNLTGVNSGDQDLTGYALLAGRAGGQTLIGGSGVTDILKLQGTSGNGTATSPAIQALVGNNGGTVAYTVLNNGNVGIGTTTPGQKLDVAGNGQFTGTYPYVNLKPSGWADAFYFQAGVDALGASTGDYTEFINPTGKGFSWNEHITPRMVILPTSGNVGIGTTSPSYPLTVNGNVLIGSVAPTYPGKFNITSAVADTTATGAIMENTASAGIIGLDLFNNHANTGEFFIGIGGATATGWSDLAGMQTYGAIPLFFGTNFTERMRITSTGNVGIGTTSPTAKLHLAAGVATANGAPLKLTPGVLLTTPELGAIEMTDDGTTAHIYMTVRIATVVTRVQVV